jgi:hypothetical protein
MTETRQFSPIEGPKGRLGRLQRGCLYCFTAQNGEARSSDLQSWCRPRTVHLDRRPLKRWERENIRRALHSIGAVPVRRIGRHEWLWRAKAG